MSGGTRSDWPNKGQLTTFFLIYVAYMGYYFCRKNYPFWLDAWLSTSSISNTQAGLIGSTFELVSGASKLLLAVFVDTHSPSHILSFGLLISTFTNLSVFALSLFLLPGSPLQLALFVCSWGVNGMAQAVGWPALARIFLAWFPNPSQRGFWYSLLSTNQNLGGALIPFLVVPAMAWGGWRAALVVPALVGMIIAGIVYVGVENEPKGEVEEVDEEVDGKTASDSSKSSSSSSPPTSAAITAAIKEDVLFNSSIWLLSLSYFFISIARNGLGDWAILFLDQLWGLDRVSASSCLFFLELGGFLGSLAGGMLSDRLFDGRRAPIIGGFSFFAIIPILLLSSPPVSSPFLMWVLPPLCYFLFGVFSFAPHVLIGLFARELCRPIVQSTAGGVVKFLGQVGGAMAGAPLGVVVDMYGWGVGLKMIGVFAFGAGAVMVPLWRKGALNWNKKK